MIVSKKLCLFAAAQSKASWFSEVELKRFDFQAYHPLIQRESVDPFPLHVSCAHAEQQKAEPDQHRKTQQKAHVAVVAYQGLQDICPVCERHGVGEGPQKNG